MPRTANRHEEHLEVPPTVRWSAVSNPQFHGLGRYFFARERVEYQGHFKWGRFHGEGMIVRVDDGVVLCHGQWCYGMLKSDRRWSFGAITDNQESYDRFNIEYRKRRDEIEYDDSEGECI